MSRLFVFGCSATSWHWPTWAEMLGRSYDHYENWGITGIGNRAIAERVSECVAKNKIGPGDTVIVQWTHFHRYDSHVPGIIVDSSWRCSGNIHSNPYELQWVKDGWREQSYAMHSLNFIQMIKALLDNNGCQYYFTTIDDLTPEFVHLKDLEIYQDMWNSIDWIEPIYVYARRNGFAGTPMYRSLVDMMWRVTKRTSIIDPHPTPKFQLGWLKENLLAKLGVSVDEQYAQDIIRVFDLVDSPDNSEKIYKEQLGWERSTTYVQGL